jgi:hypothetical protein
MAQSSLNTKLVAHIDCPGGGQVWVQGNTLFVGHMRNPRGTTLYDISDPKAPKELAAIDMPAGWHSHKVRVANDIMVVNHERLGEGDPDFGGGLGIYDVSNPSKPRLLTKWKTAGSGVHRYSFDGRYVYLSPTVEGYVGNITMILDLKDPAKPVEVGRWWIPGQWTAGGEAYPWTDYVRPRCHHPLRLGNRLYVSYWHHGFFILDIEDMSKPKLISALNTSSSFPHPTHTALPMPQMIKNRKVMVVADEDVAKLYPSAPAFTWVYDISDERNPLPISTFQVPGLDKDGSPQEPFTGCHQPSERLTGGTVLPFAWFAQGLRLVDIADPFAPKEVGHFLPDVPSGLDRMSSNDVTLDDRGLIYLIDRRKGVDIIETSVL